MSGVMTTRTDEVWCAVTAGFRSAIRRNRRSISRSTTMSGQLPFRECRFPLQPYMPERIHLCAYRHVISFTAETSRSELSLELALHGVVFMHPAASSYRRESVRGHSADAGAVQL